MRIVHVVYSCYPGRFRGGVAQAVFNLAKAQSELGNSVCVLSTNYNSGEKTNLPDGTVRTHGGLPIHYFRSDGPPWFRARSMKAFLKTAACEADLLHGHSTFAAPNLYVRQVAEDLGLASFFHVHGALDPLVVERGAASRLRKRAYISLVERPSLNSASAVFALSDDEETQLRHYGISSSIYVVPNGVPWHVAESGIDDGYPFRKTYGIPVGVPVIGYLGRIVPKKGIDILIRAIGALRGTQSVWLAIAGDPKQHASYSCQLKRLARECGVDQRTVWVGFLDDLEKKSFWPALTLFAHPSASEGMAIAPLEAMAAGVPTVVSTACYMGEAARSEAVREVPPDHLALASALNRLLGDDGSRRELACQGRQYVRQHHTWKAIADDVISLYADSMRDRPPFSSPTTASTLCGSG